MNHPSSGLLLLILSKAIPGFIHFKTTEGLSDHTIASHEYILQKWFTYQEIGMWQRTPVRKSSHT
jgi:hypothetical protein